MKVEPVTLVRIHQATRRHIHRRAKRRPTSIAKWIQVIAVCCITQNYVSETSVLFAKADVQLSNRIGSLHTVYLENRN